MNLQIRDPRARQLARRLAEAKGVSMTQAVVEALQSDLERRQGRGSLVETIERLHDRLRRLGRPGGRAMTKEEIDEMWGHPSEDGAE